MLRTFASRIEVSIIWQPLFLQQGDWRAYDSALQKSGAGVIALMFRHNKSRLTFDKQFIRSGNLEKPMGILLILLIAVDF